MATGVNGQNLVLVPEHVVVEFGFALESATTLFQPTEGALVMETTMSSSSVT